MAAREDGAPVVVGKTYDFVLWLLPKVEKFSRAYRFTVWERLSAHGLDLLVLLETRAQRSRDQKAFSHELTRMNAN